VDHDTTHDKKEAQRGALPVLQEAVDMNEMAEGADGGGGGFPKEIHADTEKDRVQDARYQYPFPQLVFADKMVRFHVGLKRYDDFFEQDLFLLFILGDSNVRQNGQITRFLL
jgi:hypothetical protein